MVCRTWGRGSGDGIDRAVLEAGVGNSGTVLEAGSTETGRSRSEIGDAASVPSQVQQGPQRTEERLRRRRTDGEATGGTGTDAELCAGSGAAVVANSDAAKIPVDASQGRF